MVRILPCLREGPIVPDVAVMGEGVGHVAQLPLLLVLHKHMRQIISSGSSDFKNVHHHRFFFGFHENVNLDLEKK